MKFHKVLMIGFEEGTLGSVEWNRIKDLSESHVIVPKDSEKILGELVDADCLLVKLGASVDKQMMDAAPKLRYIGMFGTGYGRINTAYASEKGVTVCNIAGYSTNGVAELVIGLILEHIRDISRAKISALKGEYSESSFSGYEISGKNFGIVGLGVIGARVAAIASLGFGANVAYWSRTRKLAAETGNVKFVDNINRLLANSDFVSINMAYTPETANFFSADLISSFKTGAVVVNTAPMELIDIEALCTRLAKKDFYFILDHSDELSAEQAMQLSQYENCIMYPPIGYITDEATLGKKVMFVDNLQNYLNNQPTNKVN